MIPNLKAVNCSKDFKYFMLNISVVYPLTYRKQKRKLLIKQSKLGVGFESEKEPDYEFLISSILS